jgi:nucleoside-diphosphate-sugar epimerase
MLAYLVGWKMAKIIITTRHWLVPVPVFIMTFIAKLLGKGAVANRLFGSLQVDSSKARELLGWQPVVTMDEQLSKMVKVNLKQV